MPTEEAKALIEAAKLVASELVKAADLVKAATLAKASNDLLDRIIILETKAATLLTILKWQMAALVAILAAVVGVYLKK